MRARRRRCFKTSRNAIRHVKQEITQRCAQCTSDSVQVKTARDCSEGYFGTFDSEQQDGSQDNGKQRGAQRTSDSAQVKTARDCSEGYFGTFDSEQQDGSQDNRKQRGVQCTSDSVQDMGSQQVESSDFRGVHSMLLTLNKAKGNKTEGNAGSVRDC